MANIIKRPTKGQDQRRENSQKRTPTTDRDHTRGKVVPSSVPPTSRKPGEK